MKGRLPRRGDEDLHEATAQPVFLIQRRRLVITDPSRVVWDSDQEAYLSVVGDQMDDEAIVKHEAGHWEWDVHAVTFTRAEGEAYAAAHAHNGPYRVYSVHTIGQMKEIMRALTDYEPGGPFAPVGESPRGLVSTTPVTNPIQPDTSQLEKTMPALGDETAFDINLRKLALALSEGVLAFNRILPTPWSWMHADSMHRDDIDIYATSKDPLIRVTSVPAVDLELATRLCEQANAAVTKACMSRTNDWSPTVHDVEVLADGILAFQFNGETPWRVAKNDLEQSVVVAHDFDDDEHPCVAELGDKEDVDLGPLNLAGALVRGMRRVVVDEASVNAALDEHLTSPILFDWAVSDATRLANSGDERIRNLARAFLDLYRRDPDFG